YIVSKQCITSCLTNDQATRLAYTLSLHDALPICQTAGRITHFVAGIGTGGTISGVAKYLKEQNPAIQIVGADPEGSVYSGGDGRPYLVEGIGEDFWPETYDRSLVDRVVAVSDRDSFLTARRVTRDEGILIGGSGGTAVWAALEVGKEL